METIETNLVRLRDKPALIVWPMKDPVFTKPWLDRT
jgi:hypothetical protein